MIKLKYAGFVLFFAIASTLFSCDEGGTVCDPASELTGTKWYKYLYSGTDYRAVYRFNSCGSGTYSIQFSNGSSWEDGQGMPLDGSYESEDGVCSFFVGSTNYGFEYTLSGSNLVITTSYVSSDLEGSWAPL